MGFKKRNQGIPFIRPSGHPMSKKTSITKTDRQHIVSQKMGEIVSQENDRLEVVKTMYFDAVEDKVSKEYEAAVKAVEVYKSKLTKAFENTKLPKQLYRTETPGYHYKPESKVVTAREIYENQVTFKRLHTTGYHRDILSSVLEWRGNESKRIRDASKAAMSILVDGDLEEIEAFLEL